MVQIKINGIDEIIGRIERKIGYYRDAIDESALYVHSSIKKRVAAGQLEDGTYRESKNPYNGSRYAKTQYYYRKRKRKGVLAHNFNIGQNRLMDKFVISKYTPKKKGIYSRSIYFEKKQVFSGKSATAYRISKFQINNSGRGDMTGFGLSDTQRLKVRNIFSKVKNKI